LENALDVFLDKGESQKIPAVVAVILYSVLDTSSLILSYLSGYIVRKGKNF